MSSSWNNSNDNVMWHKSNNDSSYNNSNEQTSYNNLNNKTSWNNPSNKMIIVLVVGVIVLVSGICTLCSNATKKNNTENAIENSTNTVNNYSDTNDTWTVDDQPVDNTNNGDMASAENNVDVTNGEEVIQENTTEQTILTGAASTTEAEQPVETTMPIETTTPVEIVTPVPTPAPIVTPIVTPPPTPAPIVTPPPTATPRPVITAYASLVTQYTSKDSNGQIVYILANSDKRYYSSSELQSLTSEQLKFARNEVFARRGGKFASSDLHQYFSSRSWYSPIRMAEDFEDKDLNAYEIANVKLIQSVERSR